MTDTNTDPNYQDILNKYADSLDTEKTVIPPENLEPDPNTPVTSTLTTEPERALMTEINPPTIVDESNLTIEAPSVDPVTSEVLIPPETTVTTNETVLTPPPVETVPEAAVAPETEPGVDPQPVLPPPVAETTTEIDDLSALPPSQDSLLPSKPESNFFKFLFLFSLAAFVVVLALIVKSFLASQNSQPATSGETALPTQAAESLSPTPPALGSCELNGQTYAAGQTFPASDGCNTCTCTQNSITCTTKTCVATPSGGKISPTQSASATATPKPAI